MKSSNVMCFKGERIKEDPLSTEIQRQCEGKMIPSMLPIFSIEFAAQDLYTSLACHKSPHQPTSLFMKSPFQLRSYSLSSKLILFSCLSRHGIWPWGSRKPNCFFCSCACKKLNQCWKGYQNMRQSQRRRQNQKRRYPQPPQKETMEKYKLCSQ